MTEQTWQMLIPVITLLIGSGITHWIARSNNKHQKEMQEIKFAEDKRIRSEEWERSEERRKEERLYESKVKIYLKYINYSGFEFRNDTNCEKLYALVVEIVVFAPLHIREKAMEIFKILIKFERTSSKLEKKEDVIELEKKTSSLYIMIIKDLDILNSNATESHNLNNNTTPTKTD